MNEGASLKVYIEPMVTIDGSMTKLSIELALWSFMVVVVISLNLANGEISPRIISPTLIMERIIEIMVLLLLKFRC